MLQKTPKTVEDVRIPAPKLHVIEFNLVGATPYMQHRFSQKAIAKMREKHEAGSVAGKGKKRAPRDFAADYEAAKHVSVKGWIGIPASAFRAAMISACRTVGFKMTLAKLSVFVLSDGEDKVDGSPLVRIQGNPEPCEMTVRNETGVVDIRVRPLWRTWNCKVRVRYDADQFSASDVTNLMVRVGAQVGIGEGRPDSSNSAGLGYGLFEVAGGKEEE